MLLSTGATPWGGGGGVVYLRIYSASRYKVNTIAQIYINLSMLVLMFFIATDLTAREFSYGVIPLLRGLAKAVVPPKLKSSQILRGELGRRYVR